MKKILYTLMASLALLTACSSQNVEVGDPMQIRDNDHILGPETAKATIIEYSDFQCPACKAVSPLMKQITVDYPEDVRLVYRHYPLPYHYQAIPAAKAAEAAAAQGKFFEMHDLLFANQEQWAGAADFKSTFFAYGEQLGLDMKKFEEIYDARETTKRIETSKLDDAALDIPGTPSIYLNGNKITITSYDDLKQKVEDIISGKDPNAQPL